MIHNKHSANDNVAIGRDHWDVPLPIRLPAYLNFSHRMDLQLRRLVVRWSHVASPSTRAVQKQSRGDGGVAHPTLDGNQPVTPGKSPPSPSRKKDLEP
jgi:hypothetical protein